MTTLVLTFTFILLKWCESEFWYFESADDWTFTENPISHIRGEDPPHQVTGDWTLTLYKRGGLWLSGSGAAFLLSIAIENQGSVLQVLESIINFDHSTALVDTTNIVKMKVYRIFLGALFSFKILFRCTTTVSWIMFLGIYSSTLQILEYAPLIPDRDVEQKC